VSAGVPSRLQAARLRVPSRGRLCGALGVLAGTLACLLAPGALAQGALAQGGEAQGGEAVTGSSVRVGGGGTVPSASEGAGGGTTGAAPAVSATVDQCVSAETAAGRSVTFTGQMETAPGATRMDMQIVLLEHTRGSAGFHVPSGGVGAWQRSETGVKIYKYVRQVTNLPAPAAFRALIRYRWLDETGRVMRSEDLHTPVCRQPGPSPASSPAATMPGA
jgi:hypothetical protein